MAVATRSAIQKEVFSPLEERLVAIVNVTKPGKKKKSSFLCLSGEPASADCVTCKCWAPYSTVNKQDRQVYISRVKHVEARKGGGMVGVGLSAGGALYRRAKSWSLGEVKVVDGRNTTSEVTEFHLHIDKTVYKWVASNVAEKKSFISCIFKVCGRKIVYFADLAPDVQ